MKRITFFLSLVFLISAVLVGCSNPQGGFGPSWDVAIKVPIARNQGVTAEEIFEGEDFNFDGEIVSISETEEMDAIELGSFIDDIDLSSLFTATGINIIDGNQTLPSITAENINLDTDFNLQEIIFNG